MASMFGPPKLSAYGSFGEFMIGSGADLIRARYVLTKMKPGTDGTWENALASHMVPWCEIFNIEELSFDELLQRDLDDSRVAHDLIPYLLGAKGDHARFFPPILAVVVPKKDQGTGIKGYYPVPTVQEEGRKLKFGDLFDFRQLVWGEDPTPLAQFDYNPQKAAFVIVDGQHRAMAVLALHRQLSDTWRGSVHESYYDHIDVTPEQVRSIELPVCIIFFPDLHEGGAFHSQGIDLKTVCREIFLVVNRHAKPVSKSRELLLDDEDIAARLLRQTLSKLKNRSGAELGLARIYCISYDDSDLDEGKQVVTGQIEYSTAVSLHKLHGAMSFGQPDAFSWTTSIDVSSGKYAKNPGRPAEILLGTDVEHLATVTRRSGKALQPEEVAGVVEKLGAIADTLLLRLFDAFRPFTIHNSAMRDLRARLSEPHMMSDPVQKKCLSLMFEGSGVREVFESHMKRLKTEIEERGRAVGEHIVRQLRFCESVMRALETHERDLHRRRSCELFRIDHAAFYPMNGTPTPPDQVADQKKLEERSRPVFKTIATQAFQLGYCMALLTVLEEMKRANCSGATPLLYDKRKELVDFLSEVYLAALSRYFTPDESATHRTLTGFVEKPRAGVMDPGSLGLRGLLAMKVNELNEKQWPFFRYLTLELAHSRHGWGAAVPILAALGNDWKAAWYKNALPGILDGILLDRNRYVEGGVEARLTDRDFETVLMQKKFEAQGAGKQPEEISVLLDELRTAKREEARTTAYSHLKASLGAVEEKETMLERMEEGWASAA